MNKIMFLPADPNHPNFVFVQHEYTAAHGGYNKAQIQLDHDLAKGHNAIAVWYDGSPDPFLAAMIDGQIYIRGHGMPGFVSIEAARGAERLHYTEVVDRLIQSGLRREFCGAIKCYNCHSAEFPEKDNPDPEQGKEPFAQMVANELYARGYKLCKFYGYIGSIDSNVKAGSSGTHKYVRVSDGKGGQVEAGRVSDSRVEFKPKIKHTFNPFRSLMKKILK
ncbi:MAG: hypothetical protein JWO38_8165 [Gemmataceae bacterium]|nr:hypothetical protein [Gemmataceae bacterium]